MSTTLTPSRRDTLRPVNHLLALLNGFAAGATIVLCAFVVLNSMDGGGLDQCLAIHSQDTCLYALR